MRVRLGVVHIDTHTCMQIKLKNGWLFMYLSQNAQQNPVCVFCFPLSEVRLGQPDLEPPHCVGERLETGELGECLHPLISDLGRRERGRVEACRAGGAAGKASKPECEVRVGAEREKTGSFKRCCNFPLSTLLNLACGNWKMGWQDEYGWNPVHIFST